MIRTKKGQSCNIYLLNILWFTCIENLTCIFLKIKFQYYKMLALFSDSMNSVLTIYFINVQCCGDCQAKTDHEFPNHTPPNPAILGASKVNNCDISQHFQCVFILFVLYNNNALLQSHRIEQI